MMLAMGLDALGARLGVVGAILALLGIAAPYLWPDKKWIGWLCLAVAYLFLMVWVNVELKTTRTLGKFAPPAILLLGAAGIAYLIWSQRPEETKSPLQFSLNELAPDDSLMYSKEPLKTGQ